MIYQQVDWEGINLLFLLFFFKGYFERECEKRRGRERGERERTSSRLHTVSTELDLGLNPMNCEVMT